MVYTLVSGKKYFTIFTVEDWYNHQISNLLQTKNENKTIDKCRKQYISVQRKNKPN